MFISLFNYFSKQSSIPLSQEDIQLIQKAFVPKQFKKRQFLLREGEVCKYISFIVKGAVRQYTVDDKGNQHVLNLGIENWWTSDRESYHKLTPSIYNIDAWEETEVLMLPKTEGWYDKVNAIPAFCELRKKLDDAHHMAMQRRLHSSINYTAEYRYDELIQNYPDFLQRFPQHIIASYLGITKETLSRIRNQALKK
ncbi:Crp/Fnr family transcriptional regulator [Mucilaginibacter paludis]|uniref:Transcriptional regulator, Crp/Fnr family n=1 Tax=Mucilaginibacter paludis DSM 18603 TaxID=714943 RepID=H1Y261_9SPHI|nr:Crp/Fnr family transcriptional regulator [Mucilaginibacter paludis]EHQ26718.1 putative transcriptional regulator, Crp/Fnr family [Mucilaginibacter paludis DSM 18603]